MGALIGDHDYYSEGRNQIGTWGVRDLCWDTCSQKEKSSILASWEGQGICEGMDREAQSQALEMGMALVDKGTHNQDKCRGLAVASMAGNWHWLHLDNWEDPLEHLDKALIATGFAYDLQLRKEQGSRIEKLIPKIRDIRRNGAAAVDLCYVAMGAVDGYFESSLKEWDFAAGGLIATQAGAIISGRTGGAPDGDMVVCAGPALHAQLLRHF